MAVMWGGAGELDDGWEMEKLVRMDNATMFTGVAVLIVFGLALMLTVAAILLPFFVWGCYNKLCIIVKQNHEVLEHMRYRTSLLEAAPGKLR